MGKASFIREAVPRLPGYGVRFWPFVQDLNQLQENYGNGWQTFLGQAGTIQVFGGATDIFTAEYLSKMSGTYGETTTSETDQAKGGGGSRTTGMTGRPGLFPYEITALNAEPDTELKEILFYSGKGFAYAERLRYFADFPEFVAFQKRLNLPQDGKPSPLPEPVPPPMPKRQPESSSPPQPKTHWTTKTATGEEPKPPAREGYWRIVDPGEVFPPGGHFRINLHGTSEVWEAGTP